MHWQLTRHSKPGFSKVELPLLSSWEKKLCEFQDCTNAGRQISTNFIASAAMLVPLSLISEYIVFFQADCAPQYGEAQGIYTKGMTLYSSLVLPANAIFLISRYTEVAWPFTSGNDKSLSCVQLLNSFFVCCLHTKY